MIDLLSEVALKAPDPAAAAPGGRTGGRAHPVAPRAAAPRAADGVPLDLAVSSGGRDRVRPEATNWIADRSPRAAPSDAAASA